MAGSGWRTFTAGAVLTAAQVQAYLQDQVVQVHASAAARSSALGTAASEGMVSYRTDGKVIERYTGSAWVPVGDNIYATAAARGSVTSVEGQISYLSTTDATNDTANQLDFYNGSAWESVKTSQNNYIANGDFSKWTRGTSFSQTTVSNLNNADRWYTTLNQVTSGTLVTSQNTANKQTNDNYCIEIDATGVVTTAVIFFTQLFETPNVVPLRGKTITLSFYAQVASGTATVVGGITDGTDINGYPATGSTSDSVSAAVTTSWQRFSVSHVVQSGANSMAIRFTTPSGFAGKLRLSQVQVELGTVASPFRPAGGNTVLDTATAGSAGFDGVLVSTNSANNPSGSGTAGWAGFDVAGKNKIINGGFDFWQRGTSLSAAAGNYTADRWVNISDGTGATRTVTQQAFTPGAAPVAGYEAPYFYRFNQSVAGSGGTYNTITTKIEDVRTLAGQTATLSFWMKADTNRTVSFNAIQYFGSGGSASTNTSIGSIAVTTSWQRFSVTFTMPSISGKTIGSGSFVELDFYLPLNVVQTVDIWGVQLEAGSVATPFSRAGGTLQGELAACQRYFAKSMPVDAVPGSAEARGRVFLDNTSSSTRDIRWASWWPVPMRSIPTITVYNVTGGTPSPTVNNDNTGTSGTLFYSNLTSGQVNQFQWTASAEL